ncbi:mechanosensitive ion channel domain-containing protein [Parabacteroides sp. PF5-6]|uniref:mechanosensitive ion channel family protein n=1 Tax=Parabacteroides sp. PF5-6 TaxID=1742403 RepID=UPI002406AF28|nr:mechanosensitive ion channel domain-containing protein [Parabacteroides sp. PF5-6]MDF9829078.1 miniconductance mechanosensitive channel [Parabacteroides sp. PF5-6]
MEIVRSWLAALFETMGIQSGTGGYLDEILICVTIFLLAFLIDLVCKKGILGAFRQVAKKTETDWDDLIVDRKIIDKAIHVIPAIFLYVTLPLMFDAESWWFVFTKKVIVVYIIAIVIRFVNSLLSLSNDIYQRRKQGKSIRGFIQVIQIIIIFIGLIIIISILINQSPVALLTGLGASAAILTLVFKDTLMGFVAGIQLTANDMLRPGDWITMPKYQADGDVIDVTLNAVKVRNFDNTIVTIPPYALVSDSFQNWRGMSDSPGRRIKRSISIDMNSVKFCTPEMLDKFRKISLITKYIDHKESELHKYNEKHQIDNTILVNGRRQTNLGIFRAYIESYLKHHPQISKELTCMVRQLQPTDTGIPLELYVFSSEKRWVLYENIQSDIFDHILAVIPEFELQPFQAISGADIRALKGS